jgi:hypothetical protein
MNGNEIKMKEKTKGERFEEIKRFKLENDDVMQIYIGLNEGNANMYMFK